MLEPLAPRHLRYVDQPLDPRLEFDEGTVVGDADNHACRRRRLREATADILPGVGRELFEPEGDALAILAKYPLVQLPYDHKRVHLGTPRTAVLEREGRTPDAYSVSDTYPNPFNPETTIRFELPWASDMKVTVYNDQGQVVRTLVNETLSAGTFDITWDGRDSNGREVSTGMYVFLVEGPNLRTYKKVTFLK